MSEAYPILKHRSFFDLYSVKEDGDPFMAAARLVMDWVLQKESQYDTSPVVDDLAQRPFPHAFGYAMPEGYAGGDYNDDRWPALACEGLRDEDGRWVRWVLEYDEPDAGHDDRRWHTTVSLTRGEAGDNEACHIGVQSMCRPLPGCEGPLPDTVATPALVRSLIDLPWYVAKAGTTQLQTVPNKLSAQTFEHFAAALTDPGRKVPLVLFCTGLDGKVPEQAKQLARRGLGTVNVYIVDWSRPELREKVETLFARSTAADEYACPKSSARMYLPGVDLTNPNASRSHESWNRGALASLHPSVFAERLARRFLPNDPVPTIASLYEQPADVLTDAAGVSAAPVSDGE